ncbi:MAG: ArsR/SmtB family transcription factor [Candidatus Hadarchaeum sp.]|uniref:ArsR/SmtB family transcription factor n=1 Tax=Candidatus Hadarchaeum sp. TaxID=2883567 RepID=UPI003D13E7A4
MSVEEQLRVLKCVSDRTRLQILRLLKEGEKCVRDMVEIINQEQSLVSHHLREMRKCGLVKTRREGKRIIYRLADDSIVRLLDDVDLISKKFCR